MNDPWKSIRNFKSKGLVKHKLGLGIYCFEVIRITQPKEVENDYKKVKKKRLNLLKTINVNEGDVIKYNICDVDVRTYKWCPKNRVIERPVKGQLVRTNITLKILMHMVSKLNMFIDNHLPMPELIIYWKTSMLTVKYTFLYKKDWVKYKELIENGNNELLNYEFYWMSRKYEFDELKMLDWYKGDDIDGK